MLKKRNNTCIILAIMLSMVLLFTGCGENKKTEDVKSNNETTEQTTNESTDEANDSVKEKVEITFWALQFEPYMTEWWTKWTDEFNKQSEDTFVKLEIVPGGDTFTTKLKAAQAAGNAPEIVQSSWTDVKGRYATKGLLMPLNDLVDPSLFDELSPTVKEAVTYDGKQYAYPMFVEPLGVLYYRKDMFEAAGLDPNSPPQTWDELIETAKKLTKDDVYGLQIAGNGDDLAVPSWEFEYILNSKTLSDDWSKATVLDDPHRELLTFWKRLYSEGVVPEQALSGWWDLKPLCEGKVAMQISGSWCIGQMRGQYSELVDTEQVGVINIPTPDGNYKRTTTSVGGWFLGVDAKAKNPENAAEYITWMLAENSESMLDFFEAAGYCRYPVTNKLNEALKANEVAQNDPFFKVISERVIPYAIPEPTYPFEIRKMVAAAMDRVTIQGMDIDKSLEIAEKEINDYIKQNDLPSTKID